MKTQLNHLFIRPVLLAGLGLLTWPAAAPAQFNYSTNGDGATLTLTAYTGPGGAVDIPHTSNGRTVTAIGDWAFKNCYSVTSVTIPSGVTSIGFAAFYYCGMTSVTIPDSVTSIADWAFNECWQLNSLTLPNGITRINTGMFFGCYALPSLTMPESVTSIGSWAFYRCHALTQIRIPQLVTSLGDGAFSECYALTAVYFEGAAPGYGASLFTGENPTIYYVPGAAGWSATYDNYQTAPWIRFNYTTNNGEITITGYTGSGGAVTVPSSITGLPVTAIGDWAFLYRQDVSSVIIPGSVTRIGYAAFANCFGLSGLTLSNGVANIGGFAFNNCSGLPSITLPASVTNVDGTAFTWCTHLAEINVEALNTCYSSTNGVLFDHNGSRLVGYPEGKSDGAYTVPEGVTDIGTWAFFACWHLNTVTLADSVTHIESSAFESCFYLTSVTLGSHVASIGDFAFNQCNIGSISIPASVTSLGSSVFGADFNLTIITVDPLNPAYSSTDGALFDKGQTTLLQCPAGKTGTYALPSNVVDIADYAFQNCNSLTNVILPASVTNIGAWTFFGARNLVSVNIPYGVTSIEDYAFFDCRSLASIELPDSVTRIGSMSFYGCTSLATVTIGSSATPAVQPRGLRPKTPTGGINIGTDAFGNCPKLNAINIASQNSDYSSVDGVLFDKYQTTLLQCPGGRAGRYAVPDNVASIGDYAFDGCANLKAITIPGSVTSIGDYAFTGCTGLTGIYFQGNPPAPGGSEIFSNAANATLYYLPGNGNWPASWAGHPTSVWLPQCQTGDGGFGVRTNRFGFNVFWASGQVVVVEACDNLASPAWQPLQTNTLTSAPYYFNDPDGIHHPGRFYRLRTP